MLTTNFKRGRLPRWFFVTTPTSMVNRLTGTETWPDPITFTGGVANAVFPNVVIPAASTTLTLTPALHAGRAILLASSGGLAITPPAATGTFNVYSLIVITTIAGGSVTFDAKAGNASDVFVGVIDTNKVGTLVQYGPAANSNLITLNGTTTGGIKGDYLTFIDIGLNCWNVSGNLSQSGSVATPFSNH